MTHAVVIADPQPVVRAGLRAILQQCEDLAIDGEAGSDEEIEAEIKRVQPDLVVLDVLQPGLAGIRAIESHASSRLDTRFLIFSDRKVDEIEGAFRAGASGYVSKQAPLAELHRSVEAVLSGEIHLPEGIARRLLGVGAGFTEQIRLTAREREVLTHVAMGRSNRRVAEELGVKLRTVEAHRASLMRKTGLHNAADVTRYAIRMGLVDP
jgi:DNA-binding NarL/FixJ family response regulator